MRKQLGNHRATATNSTEALEGKIGKRHRAIENGNGERRSLEGESTVLKHINHRKGRKKSSEEQFRANLPEEGSGFLQQHVSEWRGRLRVTPETETEVEEQLQISERGCISVMAPPR